MPEIDIQHVVSCSSADKNNPAENLLRCDGSHKWKSASAGEKNISIVLQLKKSSQIHSIDIGNDGSAFVEVLVGKATAAVDTDFEVLLVASSFMTPIESRDGTNRTAVRMFGQEKLNKTAASEKWDRVKIVCTQPFSKTSQYGLSFVKFHSPPSSGDSQPKVKKFGSFSLKDNDEENIQVGSLFANRSKPNDSPLLTGAAAMRAVSRLADEQVKTSSPPHKLSSPFTPKMSSSKNKSSPFAATPTFTATPTSKPSASSDRKEEKRKRSEDDISSTPKAKLPKRPATRTSDSDSDTDEEKPKTKMKHQRSVPSASSSRDDRPALNKSHTKARPPAADFSQLMSKVTFVMSGFQNPLRGQLRDQAMEMGAKYRSDWGNGCTHLVCAFSNTPKYQQVAGKGKIVTKGWVIDSHRRKELQPWKKYRLGDAESPDESSESEEELKKATDKGSRTEEEKKETSPPTVKNTKKAIRYEDSDSGGDTEDELRKAKEIREGKKLAAPSSPVVPSDGSRDEKSDKASGQVYDQSTDEDEPTADNGADSGFPDLPDFFTDKHFFFYGEFPTGEQRLLTRYIAAYNGELEEYMSERVKFVITCQKWDQNFEQALSENSELVFVKPKWIASCHNKLKLLPFQPYIVVPN